MQEAKFKFSALDGLRGICALSVMAYHMHIIGSFTEHVFFRNSDLFVNFFFILSGFVLANSYFAKPEFSFNSFMISRIFRIIPLHLSMLGFMLLLECIKWVAYANGVNFNSVPFTGLTALAEIIPNFLLIQSWASFFSYLSFNYPSWSISVEFYSYILFGFVMIASYSYKKYYITLLILFSYILLNFDQNIVPAKALEGIFCIFSGSLLYVFFRKISGHIKLSFIVSTLLEISCLILVLLLITGRIERHIALADAVFCIVMLTFAFQAGAISFLLKRRFFMFLGKISYSIYLIHAPLLTCFIYAALFIQKINNKTFVIDISNQRYLIFSNPLMSDAASFMIATLVILLSTLTYKNIEYKFNMIGKKFSESRDLRLRSSNQTVS